MIVKYFIVILLLHIITKCLFYEDKNSSQFNIFSYVNSYNISSCNVKVIKKPVDTKQMNVIYDNILKLNYSYAMDYFQQEPKQLVLFTSVETRKSENPRYDVINHILMYSFFQTKFNFAGIVFSNSISIKELCRQHNIIVINHYQANPFGMPIVRDLYQQASHLIRSRFYGYINSDIVMSPNLFEFLSEVESRVQNREIPENLEIAGRVYDTRTKAILQEFTISGYNHYLSRCKKKVTYLRNPNSADYFILPNTFDFSVMDDAVIGRARIDNYLMMLMNNNNGYLIDTTYKVVSYHLGTTGYKQKSRSQTKQNRYWNERFITGTWLSLAEPHWRPE